MSNSHENHGELEQKASAFESKIRELTQEFSKQVAEEATKVGLKAIAEVSIQIESNG